MELLVKFSDFVNARMKQNAEPASVKGGQNFLGFSQGVTEQDRNEVFFESLNAKLRQFGSYLINGREYISGQPVGGLHDQCIRLKPINRFSGLPLPQLEISCVEQSFVSEFDMDLGGAENMPCGQ